MSDYEIKIGGDASEGVNALNILGNAMKAVRNTGQGLFLALTGDVAGGFQKLSEAAQQARNAFTGIQAAGAGPLAALVAVVAATGFALKLGLDAITNSVYRFNADLLNAFKSGQDRLHKLMPEYFSDDLLTRTSAKAARLTQSGAEAELKALRDEARDRATMLGMSRGRSSQDAANWAEAVQVLDIYEQALAGVVKVREDDSAARIASGQALDRAIQKIREEREEIGLSTEQLIALKQARHDALLNIPANESQADADARILAIAQSTLEIERLKLQATEERARLEAGMVAESNRRDELDQQARAAAAAQDRAASEAEADYFFSKLKPEEQRRRLGAELWKLENDVVDPTAAQRLRAIELRKQLDALDAAAKQEQAKASGPSTAERSADLAELFDARAGRSRRVIRMSLSQPSAFGDLGGLSGLQPSWFARSREELDAKRDRMRLAAGRTVSERDLGRQQVEIGGGVADDIREIRKNLGGVNA